MTTLGERPYCLKIPSYCGADMNGYAPSRTPYGYGPGLPPPQSQGPQPRALLDGYTKDIMNDFEGDAPRHNPVSALSALLFSATRPVLRTLPLTFCS